MRPGHLAERHSALVLVALGESVAAIGAGATRTGQESARLAVAAVLGLALAAALWWSIFGGGEQEQFERVLTAATSERRTTLALSALFYGNIPLLLGVVAMAAGVRPVISHSSAAAALTAGPVGAAAALGAGGGLFLAGDVVIRRLLGLGRERLRAAAAVLALATTAIGALLAIEAQLTVITVILVVLLVLERRLPTAA